MKKADEIKIKQGIIPEFSSGSSTLVVSQQPQQALKTLKQVQGLTNKINAGFTLIELLVVILIVGILATIAVSQYQKAVEKARATSYLALLQSIYRSQELYYIENGKYTTNFDSLDYLSAWKKATQKWWSGSTAAITNGKWNLEIATWQNSSYIVAAQINGGNQGVGFGIFTNPYPSLQKGIIYCVEKTCCGTPVKKEGHCTEVFKGTFIYNDGGAKWYRLP